MTAQRSLLGKMETCLVAPPISDPYLTESATDTDKLWHAPCSRECHSGMELVKCFPSSDDLAQREEHHDVGLITHGVFQENLPFEDQPSSEPSYTEDDFSDAGDYFSIAFDDVSIERDRQTLEHTDCLDSEDGLLASLPNQVGADSNSVLQFTRVMSSEANTLFSLQEAEALPPGKSLRLLES